MNAHLLDELRKRERNLAEMVRGMANKKDRLDESLRQRIAALQNIRTTIARALLRESRGPASHEHN